MLGNRLLFLAKRLVPESFTDFAVTCFVIVQNIIQNGLKGKIIRILMANEKSKKLKRE